MQLDIDKKPIDSILEKANPIYSSRRNSCYYSAKVRKTKTDSTLVSLVSPLSRGVSHVFLYCHQRMYLHNNKKYKYHFGIQHSIKP